MALSFSLNNSIDESQLQSNRLEPIIIQIKRNAGSDIQAVDLRKYEDLTIYAFKEKYFQKELQEKMTIRCIYEGKQLNDEDKVSSIKFKNGTYLHAFISKPIVQENNVTVVSAESFDNDKRGFDKLRAYDVMEEELILFHGKFHSKTILILKDAMVTEQVLFEYEEEWCRENLPKIINAEIARKIIQEYDPGFPEERGDGRGLATGLFLGVALFVFATVIIIFLPTTLQFRRGVSLGLFVDVCFLLVFKFFVLEPVY